jgi:hypothetical protein
MNTHEYDVLCEFREILCLRWGIPATVARRCALGSFRMRGIYCLPSPLYRLPDSCRLSSPSYPREYKDLLVS